MKGGVAWLYLLWPDHALAGYHALVGPRYDDNVCMGTPTWGPSAGACQQVTPGTTRLVTHATKHLTASLPSSPFPSPQAENKFKCPCHGSQYNNEGRAASR